MTEGFYSCDLQKIFFHCSSSVEQVERRGSLKMMVFIKVVKYDFAGRVADGCLENSF